LSSTPRNDPATAEKFGILDLAAADGCTAALMQIKFNDTLMTYSSTH
jgi:hypothetical protein